MPVNLGQRAELTDEFLNALATHQGKRRQNLQDELRQLRVDGPRNPDSDYYVKLHEAEIQSRRVALQSISDNDGGDLQNPRRGGLGYQMMRLRKAPFVKFDVKNRRVNGTDQQWFIGETDEVIGRVVTRAGKPKRNCYVKAGVWFVCIDVLAMGRAGNCWHVLPKGAPKTANRHMHHYAHGTFANPLDAQVSNCLGSFSNLISTLTHEGDVVELFYILYKFLSTFNPTSPLQRWPSLPHVRLIDEPYKP
jgi:hypothetical protein